jgi:3-phosphoshikimate 1-carboxyvinyltransferase
MQGRCIRSARSPLRARLRAVPSKSGTHRALVAAALASGTSVLRDPLDADDTVRTRDGIRSLGIPVAEQPSAWVVHGAGGTVPGGGSMRLGASGTSFRFLLALASLGRAPSRLEGSERLGERPILELAGAIASLGGEVSLPPGGAGLPAIAGGKPMLGGSVRLAGRESSQFASALLLIGSRLPRGLDLAIDPGAVSLPYVRLTARVLEEFGVPVEGDGVTRWRISPADYRGREHRIEGDHSSASYFLAAAALVGGVVRVEGLRPDSLQPDAAFGSMLRGIGCEVTAGDDWIEARGTGTIPGFELDLRASPDLAPTLAVLALFAEGPCRLTGIGHLRSKESDRLEVLAAGLARIGRQATADRDALAIGPPPAGGLHGGVVATASDHRIAMAFAVAGLRLPGIVIDDEDAVTKSHPGFWRDFSALEPTEGPLRTGS